MAIEGSTEEYEKESEGPMEDTSNKERIKSSISSVRGRIEVILICREGKVKSPGGRILKHREYKKRSDRGAKASTQSYPSSSYVGPTQSSRGSFRFLLKEQLRVHPMLEGHFGKEGALESHTAASIEVTMTSSRSNDVVTT